MKILELTTWKETIQIEGDPGAMFPKLVDVEIDCATVTDLVEAGAEKILPAGPVDYAYSIGYRLGNQTFWAEGSWSNGYFGIIEHSAIARTSGY